MKLSELTKDEFRLALNMLDTKNMNSCKSVFREMFNRDLVFDVKNNKSFCSLAFEILPTILNKKARAKNALNIVLGNDTSFKSFDKLEIKQPYLLREQKGEVLGMVRIKDCKALDSKEYEYNVFDIIPFVESSVKHDFKFNDEKMQMFSVAYRSWEAWQEPDTDNEYIREIDLNKMVKQVAETGLELNIEHDGSTTINKSDARITEFYQARTDWNENGLSIRKGDIVSTTQFYDTAKGRALWNDLKGGVYTTYSIEGNPQEQWERVNENE